MFDGYCWFYYYINGVTACLYVLQAFFKKKTGTAGSNGIPDYSFNNRNS